MGVTHFPHGLSTNDGSGPFRDLPSVINTRELWQALFEFDLPLDTGGGDSEWIQYPGGAAGALAYPAVPFGVVELQPGAGNIYGVGQENCQSFDFTRGTDLWYRVSLAQPTAAQMNIWAGMVDEAPPVILDEFNEACIFHVLTTGQIDLEFWSAGVLVQTINAGTYDRSGVFTELGYHFNGESIEVAINGVTVATAVVLTVPNITLHGLMGSEDTGGGIDTVRFDYYYAAQLRQPL